MRFLVMCGCLCLLAACAAPPAPKPAEAPRPSVKPPAAVAKLEVDEKGEVRLRPPAPARAEQPPAEVEPEVEPVAAPPPAKAPENATAGARHATAVEALRAGRDAEALNLLTALTRDYPAMAGPWVNLGIVQYRAKQYEAARAAFQQALGVNPESAISFNYLGILSRIEGDFNQALEYYTNALAINLNYANAHLNMGILQELYLGQPEAALGHYKRYYVLTGEKDATVYGWIVDLERRLSRK